MRAAAVLAIAAGAVLGSEFDLSMRAWEGPRRSRRGNDYKGKRRKSDRLCGKRQRLNKIAHRSRIRHGVKG